MTPHQNALADLVRALSASSSRRAWTQLTDEQKDLLAATLAAGHRPHATGARLDAFSQLRVVTSAAWLAKELSAAGLIDVEHDLGIDLRVLDVTAVAWWAPMSFAARLVATTGVNPFLSPGPHWMSRLPQRWSGRQIETTRMEHLPELVLAGQGGPVHVKPAEVKVASVPAAVHSSVQAFLHTAPALTSQVVVQVSGVVEYVREYRCFTVGRTVAAASIYLHGGRTWDVLEVDDDGLDAARQFAGAVLADRDVDAPDAMALDVGQHPDGSWSVVEANPAWSSNPYHCDPGGVVTSVCSGQRRDGSLSRWAWVPDPHLTSARPLVLTLPTGARTTTS